MALVDRVKGICLKPQNEWQAIEGETTSAAVLLKNYALPLAAIGAVAGFVGMSFIGISVPFLGSIRTPIVSGFIGAAVHIAATLAGVYVLALIIDALAPQFGGQKNQAQALKVAVYSFTPAWVGGVLAVIPALGIIGGLVGLYGIYLLYLGLLQLMKSPKDKATVYTVVVVLIGVVLFWVIGFIKGLIVMPSLGSLTSGLR